MMSRLSDERPSQYASAYKQDLYAVACRFKFGEMIPSGFDILGNRITISVGPMRGRLHGDWDSRTLTIRINEKDPPEVQRATLWHEITHCVLHHMGYDKLNNDETFVDRIGQCLNQVTKTLDAPS